MMPAVARKIIVCAAIDGLILQPLPPKGQRSPQSVKVQYDDASVSVVPRDQVRNSNSSEPQSSFEAFGVVGLITVSRSSYLVTITRRQQVAQIFGFPVYVVTGVAITPCSTKQEADESIRRTVSLLQKQTRTDHGEETDSSEEEAQHPEAPLDEVEDAVTEEAAVLAKSSHRSSVAEDVMRRRGSYGRFAQRWFSKSGWTLDQRRSLGLSLSSANSPEALSEGRGSSASKISVEEELRLQSQPTELLPKLLRTVQVLLGSSRSFYFSYDIDLTRSTLQQGWLPKPDEPLYAQVDSHFFWNRRMLQNFTATDQELLCLPLMQGFIGQRTFTVDSDPPQADGSMAESLELAKISVSESLSLASEDPASSSTDRRPSERSYLLTLVSRRSIKRAGLRYLRRGIDEEGFPANMVETEQLLSSPTWDPSIPIRSFLQIRGSIPLFFTQTAYSLKPVPVVQHGPEANYEACKRHFDRLRSTYGSLQVVNLVEKKGVEQPIGTLYEQNVERLNAELGDNSKQIAFEWFDFHHACRGMKFENVSQLLTKLKGKLEELGSTTKLGADITQRQTGVLRTNCMDCLDRTNVCQSSFAKHMLDLQLKQEGIDMSLQLDQETAWFNTLWADNGDAVSKQYASTAAMKGDYTRTRKRDYRGALNDLGLSMARFYSGMVNDYFSQAAMDFLLGNVTAKVFDEFESDMMTKDPAVSVVKMRQRAVELCQKRVVADMTEEFQGGWALISPNAADVVKSWPMEDVILLLTDAALYLCRFDWDQDKVSSFERIHLSNVTHIKFGTYITSTMSPAHMDEMKNIGFLVLYQPGQSNIRRTNTRTLSSNGDVSLKAPSEQDKRQVGLASIFAPKTQSATVRKLAFKAPYMDSSIAVAEAGGGMQQQTELQQVVTICAEIERLALEAQFSREGSKDKGLMEKGDIISLQEAKKNTSLLEQLGHSIKKFVWA